LGTANVLQGRQVIWEFPCDDRERHRLADVRGGRLFDSGRRRPGASFVFPFPSAGRYAYRDLLHPRIRGAVKVPLSGDVYSYGNQDTKFKIVWASRHAPPRYVYDVQVRGPGDKRFRSWKNGVTNRYGYFKPDGPTPPPNGYYRYYFRARLRQPGTRTAWAYSPQAPISVSAS
jgi:hypothetical protein